MIKSSPKQLKDAAEQAYKRGNYKEAAQIYQQAAQEFLLAGETLTAAEMDNNSCVAFLQAGDAQSALEAVADTEEIFAKAGDLRRQALALGNLGMALQELERYPEAEQAYSQSAELLAQLGENDLRLKVLQSLSELQLRTGRRLDALATMQAGLEGLGKMNPKQRLLKKLLQMPSRFMG